MKKTMLVLILIYFSCYTSCQTPDKRDFNFSFEKISNRGSLPDNWFKWGTQDFVLRTDTIEKHSGSNSLRIEPAGTKSAGSFGCVAYSIPAVYIGTQIELRAYLKLQNVEDGQIGLMLRIDGDNGSLAFDNLQREDIHGTSDWTLYSVKLPLPEEAKKIYIGALLTGTGKLWVDDFQLLIDGVSLDKAKLRKTEEFKAQKDNEFDKGSNIFAISLTTSKIEDLVILGKVWGFLKYYHPAISKGEYNWDYDLFRIFPKIIGSKTMEERNAILTKWILSLGELEKSFPEATADSLIKNKPDLSWITDSSTLGEDLIKQLLLVRDSKRINKHYYIGFLQGVGNPVFKNENPYAGYLTYTDAGYRLLSLYRYWNIIQYYFPYKNLIDEDWNKVLAEFLPQFVNATGELDYKLAVLALIARVHDTHANIWGNDMTLQNYKGVNYAPVTIKYIDKFAVVTGFIGKEQGSSGLQKGDIILSINSKSIDKIIEEKLPFTPASNYPTQLRDIAKDLLRSNDSILNITFKRNNSIIPLTIKCYPPNKINLYESLYRKDTCYRLITPQIACIYPGTIKSILLPKIMSECGNTKGLIIDMRCYPSDFIVFSLGEYLMPNPVDFVKFSGTSYYNPGLFTFGVKLKVGKSNNDYYKGKVVIIVNEISQSQAEYTTMAFRMAPRATVIGSTTAGADGNVSEILLPGGIRTMISGIGVYYPDGKETQRIGIVPDIEVRPTIKGIIEGRDELIEKAVEIINKEKNQ